MNDSYEISFGGLTSETGPMTWAQRHIWTIQDAHADHRQQFNLFQLWRVPPGNSDRAVLSALRRLVERHEALRTRLLAAPGGGLVQQVDGEGGFAVRVRDIGTVDRSEEELCLMAEELVDGDFAWEEESLVRFGILTAGGAPALLVTVVSHMIADGAAGPILEHDYMALLAQKPGLPEPTCQPLQWAAKERSPRGAETSRRSAEYMRDVLQKHPGRLFGASGATSGTRGFPVVLGHGPGLGRQVKGLAGNWGTSEAAVALTVLARTFAAQTGIDSFPLGVTCSNRHLPGSSGYVGMLAQNGVIGVDTSSGPLPEAAARTWRSLLTGYTHSAYDQDELGDVLAEAGLDDDYLGFGAVGHFVNFRVETDPTGPDSSWTPATIRIEEGDPADYRIPRFGVVVSLAGDDLAVRMFADPAVIPADLASSVTRSFLENLQSLRG